MIPILLQNIRSRRTSTFFWSLGMVLYVAMTVLVYASISDQAQQLNDALKNFPDTAKSLFTDAGDFLSPVGYLSSNLYYLLLPLLFSMLTIGSSSLLSREEQDGTLELLLARPVSRGSVYLAKFLASVVIIGIVGLVTLVITLITAPHGGFHIPAIRFVGVTFLTVLLSLVFGSFAWMLAGLGGLGRRSSFGAGAMLALGSYLITSLAGTAHWLSTPAKYLPYHYFQPSHVLYGTYNWWNAVVLVAVAAVFVTIGCVGFVRRDLR